MNRLRRLLGEIRKRSLWQVLASYVLGSWIILQIAETLSSLIGLPLWFGQAVLLVLLPGLPVVLVTAALQHTRVSDAAEPKPASWTRKLFTRFASARCSPVRHVHESTKSQVARR